MRSLPVLCLLVACTSPSRADTQEQSPPLGAPLSGTTPRHMINCPSAVWSAKTVMSTTPDGVDITVTSKDPAAAKKIAALATWHSSQRGPIWAMPPHTGMHGGPGSIGHCPIIHANTVVSVREIPEGARIHVATNPTLVRQLQRLTDLRVRALQPASS